MPNSAPDRWSLDSWFSGFGRPEDADFKTARVRDVEAWKSEAAALNVNGLHAWGRLCETLSGKMEFEMTFPDGQTETVPMSRRRALMSEPDRRLREAAFHRGQKPWLDHAATLAAGLNVVVPNRTSGGGLGCVRWGC